MQSAERSSATAVFKVTANIRVIAVRRWRILIVINLNVLFEKRDELFFGGEGQNSPLSALSSSAH